MKNIKYRAYIINERTGIIGERVFEGNQRMVYDFIALDGDGFSYYDTEFTDADEIFLMMFIGKQDKHGTDIYEGDVVTFMGNYCDKKYLGKHSAEIIWDEHSCGFFFKMENGELLGINNYKDGTLEIIGNIYEGVKNDI